MAADDLTTLANVKTAAKILDTGDDARISQAIEDVTEAIKAFCHREVMFNPLSAVTTTEFHDGGGHDFVNLQEGPVISLISVHDDLDRVYGASTLLVEDVDFVLYPEDSYLETLASLEGNVVRGTEGGRFQKGQRNVRVVYVAGYLVIPRNLETVAIRETISMINKDRGQGLTRTAKGPVSEDYALTAFTALSRKILNRYRSLVA